MGVTPLELPVTDSELGKGGGARGRRLWRTPELGAVTFRLKTARWRQRRMPSGDSIVIGRWWARRRSGGGGGCTGWRYVGARRSRAFLVVRVGRTRGMV